MNPDDVIKELKKKYIHKIVRFKNEIEGYETIIDGDMIGVVESITYEPEYVDEDEGLMFSFQFDLDAYFSHNKTCMKSNYLKHEEYNSTALEAGFWKSKESVFVMICKTDDYTMDDIFSVIGSEEAIGLSRCLDKTSYGDFYMENGHIKASKDIKRGERVDIDYRLWEVLHK